MNDYEKAHMARYEGTYTPEEIELNKRLYDECSKDILDCDAIEQLLEHGADPLGATAVSGWDLLKHVYGELVSDLAISDTKNIPKITELFLKHGMDIDKPRIPYDDDNSLHPMWMFTFALDENTLPALGMLLDNGLSADAAGEMWGHATFDLINLDCGDPCNDEFWKEVCTWTMKAIMLCASYDHILDNDEDVRNFIDFSLNSYDIHKFRRWNDFYYEFDTSGCRTKPEFYGSTVRIYEVDSKTEVWKIVI